MNTRRNLLENQHAFSQETGISRTSILRILHDDLKLFPYKIQILQRQTDQNKAELETFYEDISQKFENDPGLLDLNDLNDVNHSGLCGASATLLFCGASATLPVSQNLTTKPFYQVHCSCQNLTCIAAVSEKLILWQIMPQWFLLAPV